jgi:hypothetical protein
MKYQDLKIRDAMRLGGIGVVLLLLIAGMLVFKDAVKPALNAISDYRAHNNEYTILLCTFGLMSPLCFGVSLWYLITTPAQNARSIISAGRPLPPTLSESDNPYYGVPTWKYILERPKKRT